MRDYKVGGRGHFNVDGLFRLLGALAGAPGGTAGSGGGGGGGGKVVTNTDNTQTTPAYDDSGNPISNVNNANLQTQSQQLPTVAKPNLLQMLAGYGPGYQQYQIQSALSAQRAGQERQTKTTENQLNKDYQNFIAKLDYMQKNGVAPTLENFKAADAATTSANISRLGSQAKTGESVASGTAKEAASPQGQDVVAQNFLSQENEPFARNMAMMPKIAPYETGYQRLPDQYTLSIEGGKPGSTTSSQSGYAINPKTGFPTQTSTSTTTPTFSGANVHDMPVIQDDANSYNEFMQQQQPQSSPQPAINPSPVLAKPPTPLGGNSMGVQAPMNPMFQMPMMAQPQAPQPAPDNSAAMQLLQIFQNANKQTNNAAGQGIMMNPAGQGLPDWMRILQGQQQ